MTVAVDPGTAGHTPAVSLNLAARSLSRLVRMPGAIVPTLVMPLFFLLGFSGAYESLTELPGFPTDNILSWMAPWAVVQGAAFSGIGASIGVANDLEIGFYDRLVMAPTTRLSLLLGSVLAALARVALPFTTVLTIALIAGAEVPAGVAGVLMLLVACEGIAVLAALGGLSIVYRLRTQRSMSLVQVLVFVTMFLSIGQVPLAVMNADWLHTAARINPMTNLLRLARQGFIGDVTWGDTWPGLVVIAVGALVLGWTAMRGLRNLTG